MDVHAADTDLELTPRSKDNIAHIGVSWQEGLGKYKLTKVVNFAPRFLLKNDFSESLYTKEYKALTSATIFVGKDQRVPLYHFKYNARKLFTFAETSESSNW